MINIEQFGKRNLIIFDRDESGKRIIKHVTNFRPYFYNDKKEKVFVDTPSDVSKVRQRFSTHYEADIRYPQRYLIDCVSIPIPKRKLRICYLDIEVSDACLDTVTTPAYIICITCYDNFLQRYVTFVWRKDLKEREEKTEGKSVYYFNTENGMMLKFIQFIRQTDPDLLVGWSVDRFDMTYIINRCNRINVDISKISPLNYVKVREFVTKSNFKVSSIDIKGRFVIDLQKGYRQIFGELPSYSLAYVSQRELGEGKVKHLKNLWEDIDNLIEYNRNDVRLTVLLDNKKKIVEFYDSLRRVTGCTWENTKVYSSMVDVMLLRKGKSLGLILPSKPEGQITVPTKGGFVLKTKPGVHKGVIVLDTVTTYPGIVREFNLSYDTVTENGDIKLGNGIQFNSEPEGLVPSVIDNMIQHRMEYKNKMKSEQYGSDEYNTLYSSQFALKCVINAGCYGATKYERYRFFDPRITDSITWVGRELVKWSNKVINEQGYETIYADSVTKDSVVVLKHGRKTMEEVWDSINTCINNGAKKERKKCSIEVLTLDDNFKTTFSNCNEIIRHKVNKKMYELLLTNEEKIRVTQDHGVITISCEGMLKTVSPLDLKKGDVLIQPKRINRNDSNTQRIYSEELMEFFGMWIGDGSYGTRNSVGVPYYVNMSCGKSEYAKHLVGSVCREFGCSFNLVNNDNDATVGSISLGKLMTDLGFVGYSDTKRVPQFIFSLTEGEICDFLRGYISADGYINKSKQVGFASVNKLLVYDLQYLFALVGIKISIFTTTHPNAWGDDIRTRKSLPTYSTYGYVRNKKEFFDCIGFLDPAKKSKDNVNTSAGELIPIPKKDIGLIYGKKYAENRKRISRRVILKNLSKMSEQSKKLLSADIHFATIREIKEIEYSEYVYDLCVPSTQRFFANGILVHNTDSSFIQTNETDLDTLLQIQSQLLKVVNESYTNFVQQFGVKKNRFLAMDLDRIYRNILFTKAKKRYVGKLLFMNDKPTNELHYMGFESKRSDFSVFGKEVQTQVFDMVLEGKTRTEIDIFVQQMRKRFKEITDLDTISISRGIVKRFEDYRANSIHIRAAKYSNKYLGQSVGPGDKVRMLYVKNVWGKPNTNIVCYLDDAPQDIEVDFDKMFFLTVVKKINNIYEAMGWGPFNDHPKLTMWLK